MPKARSNKAKKRTFYGIRYTTATKENLVLPNIETASSSKLKIFDSSDDKDADFQTVKSNKIIDIQTLISIFPVLCCPQCFATGLKLSEDSKEGLCSNFNLACDC